MKNDSESLLKKTPTNKELMISLQKVESSLKMIEEERKQKKIKLVIILMRMISLSEYTIKSIRKIVKMAIWSTRRETLMKQAWALKQMSRKDIISSMQ